MEATSHMLETVASSMDMVSRLGRSLHFIALWPADFEARAGRWLMTTRLFSKALIRDGFSVVLKEGINKDWCQ
jgi:hypothetical protein